MKEIDFSKIKKVYFLGIGGIGVSAIARMMLAEGKWVGGSDTSQSEITDELLHLGAHIEIGQKAELVSKEIDLVIYTIAIATYDPAILEALRARNIPLMTYPEALGAISRDKYTIAVSGTHGKTTTTAMVAKILIDTNKDPTVVVGSLLKDVKSNFVAGKGKYFVAEACEYRRSFLNLTPSILVITNIDNDHLDYYKDLDDIISAFHEMAMKVALGGFIVCDPNDERVKKAVIDSRAKVIDYTRFQDDSIKLRVPGEHNRKNAAVVLAVASILEIDKGDAGKSLEGFSGTWRRFEYKGEFYPQSGGSVSVYDDYGHHPTEVKATLSGAREMFPDRKIIVVFQPHLFSRTKLLLDDFANAFGNADVAIFAPIYPAREVFDPSISSEVLTERAQSAGMHAIALTDFSAIEGWLKENTKEGDVVLTMGAGDIYKVGESLLQ